MLSGKKEIGKSEKDNAAVAGTVVHAEYRGPLPQASEFRRYEETLPGAANRILKMAEKSLDAEIEDNRRYRVMTFVSMLFNKIIIYVLIIVSVILVFCGKNVEALLVGLVPIVQILSTIEVSKNKKK